MGTLLWLRPATTAFAPPIAAGPSAAHVVAGGGIKGRPRRVSLALRCPDPRPRVIQEGRGRRTALRSYVTASGAAAAADDDSSRVLSDFRPGPLSRASEMLSTSEAGGRVARLIGDTSLKIASGGNMKFKEHRKILRTCMLVSIANAPPAR